MHEIKLKKLEFSNVNSFGNNITEVSFDDGITLLRGANGAGKSSIIEALTFVLFGTPYRDVNKIDIKNTANEKGKVRVFLSFDKINSLGETISYELERSMTNNGKVTFSISNSVDGIEKKVAGISQKVFEDEVLGFNQTIYYNIISLNTVMTTPFIDMDASEKRKLTESIVTQQLDKYKTANKKELSDNQVKFDSATSDVVKYKKDSDEISNIIIDLEKETQVDINNIKTEITDLDNVIKDNNTKLVSFKSEQEVIVNEGKIVSDKIDSYGDIQSKINGLDQYQSAMTSIDGIKIEYNDSKKSIDDVNVELLQLSESIKVIIVQEKSTSIKMRLNTSNRTLGSLTGEKTASDKTLAHIKAEADALQSGVPCPTCGKPSTNDDIELVKDSYRAKYKKELTENKRIIAEIDKLKVVINSDTELLSNTEQLESQITAINQQISIKNSSLSQYKNQSNKLATKISEMEGVLNAQSIDISKISELVTSLRNDQKIVDDLKSKKLQLTSDYKLSKSRESDLINIINGNKVAKEKLEAKLLSLQQCDNREALVKAKERQAGALSDYNRALERVNKYSDKVAVCKYISGMFDDNGIKKIILSIFVPNLNKSIENILSLFEMPFMIEFDDAMNYRFSSKFGMANVYGSLSQGEQRKLNFAIAMAFRDFVTNIADFKINILFLDEVIDISTDEKALVDMIILVKKKQPTIGNINVISHRGDVIMEYIDRIIDVYRDGLYSELKITKLH